MGGGMSEGVRVIGPDRVQLRWDMVDLDSQLPDDHRARLVWAFVEGLDLSEFYDRINHDLLAGFRRENAALLDRLLTQSVTGLIAEKLVTLEEMAIDGTKARAWAGRGSMCKRKRLEGIEQAVAERVAALRRELDTDAAEPERRRKRRALQAAQERAQRVERARQKLAELEQEKAARAKTHAKEEAEKGEPKVSVS